MGLSPFHVVDCVTRCSRRPKSMCLSAVRGAWVQLSEWSNLRGYCSWPSGQARLSEGASWFLNML